MSTHSGSRQVCLPYIGALSIQNIYKGIAVYLTKVEKKLGFLGAASQLLAEQLRFEGFVLVSLSLHRVLEVDLVNDLSEQILVELLAELLGQLKNMVRIRKEEPFEMVESLTLSNSLAAEAMDFLEVIWLRMNLICQTMA